MRELSKAVLLSLFCGATLAQAEPLRQPYRGDLLRIPREMKFEALTLPISTAISYQFEWGKALFDEPIGQKGFEFIDKFLFRSGSSMRIADREFALTCVRSRGVEKVLQIMLVADDPTCTGPVNPKWPHEVREKDTWETYLILEFTSTSPVTLVSSKIHYGGNEYDMRKL